MTKWKQMLLKIFLVIYNMTHIMMKLHNNKISFKVQQYQILWNAEHVGKWIYVFLLSKTEHSTTGGRRAYLWLSELFWGLKFCRRKQPAQLSQAFPIVTSASTVSKTHVHGKSQSRRVVRRNPKIVCNHQISLILDSTRDSA